MTQRLANIPRLVQWLALWRPGAPLLLDAFSGAGGAAMGYWRAGFNVIGCDIKPQPHYPFPFWQMDALDFIRRYGPLADAIHASPPCQGYSRLRHLPWLKDNEYPLLIEPVRELLKRTGKPYVIENVEDAPLKNATVLCGYSMGLPVYRHRKFETSFELHAPPHRKHEAVIGSGPLVNDRRKGSLNNGSRTGSWRSGGVITVAGGQFAKEDGEKAMDIYWMSKYELTQSIPPAYTEWIGAQLMTVLEPGRGANDALLEQCQVDSVQLALFG